MVSRAAEHAATETDGVGAPKIGGRIDWICWGCVSWWGLVALHSLLRRGEENLSDGRDVIRDTHRATGNVRWRRDDSGEWGRKCGRCMFQFAGNGTGYQLFLSSHESVVTDSGEAQ